jgi:hypothetical protein
MATTKALKRKRRLAVFFLAAGCAFLLSKQSLLTTTSEATVLSSEPLSGGSTRAVLAVKIAGKSFPSAKAIQEDEAVAHSAQAEEAGRSALALKQTEKAFPQEDEAKVKAQKPARFRTSAVKELMPRIDTDGNGEIGWHEFRALARSNSERKGAAAHAHRVAGLRIQGYEAVPKQSLSFMQTWTHHDAQTPSELQVQQAL